MIGGMDYRHAHRIESESREAMAQTIAGESGVADLILRPTPEKNRILLAVRNFMLSDIEPDIAMTDQSLYRKLTRMRMEMTIRGWRHFFQG